MTLDWRKIVEIEDPAQYQRALIFNARFQKSETCKGFRVAWSIPAGGFASYTDFKSWEVQLIERTNEYLKSDKYRTLQQMVEEKRMAMARHEITDFDFELFATDVNNTVSWYKYDYDIDEITIHSGAPIYWRDFIEQCLLFDSFEKMPILPIKKRLPEPKLKWDRRYQYYELVIENVFPDTNLRELATNEVGKKLKELQKNLPGYHAKRTRFKKNLQFGLEVLKMDERPKNLTTDAEKVDALRGEVPGVVADTEFGRMERKRTAWIKQLRSRTRRVIGRSDTKRNG